ncbi:type II toxin-antitoxin system VapC family toxin [Salmonella enterica subsp. diarizonae]|uniref:tRNA(fMet)-specific endonuclease VapC n=1 Tax=Salmonella newport TaxID=108619 RepID=A0A5U9KWD6_SALNE|nr:type II toxin-antitoxin system VapC family toxin [Salmonella enterica]EAA6844822.1 type II toxin-antitoxin system VapC family toxin [Salmonella enterica subsp. enterica serovar Pensacola]EAW1825195.1 type II toxin-antitoxin system VapC family toxin [Salmonella enterica subsp. diarizonae]EBK1959560.1 type II toxin-antitoxin system VapC family toxin [Salmonella enterica subsp. enterica serovar Newport]EDT6983902.1 type II toxin-antitoxin system VapC family toxin [Salmonella enterica subsp. ari
MFILDTNVISELRKAGDGKADSQVMRWLSSVNSRQLYLSVITLLELERGILRVERRDVLQGQMLRRWLDGNVLPVFADRILPVDVAVVRQCARLHVPDPRPESDTLIAATALVHGMTVVTRNVADFEPTGVAIINPWVS